VAGVFMSAPPRPPEPVPACLTYGNFGFLDPPQSDYATAQIAVLPLPYDSTTSFKSGTRAGPRAILDASWGIDLLDEETGFDPGELGIATLAPVHPHMAGPEFEIHRITDACQSPLDDGKFLVTIGGEHTVSVGVCRALVDRFGPFSILQIDAHLDLRDSWEDTRWNHACVMRRMAEMLTAAGGDGPRLLAQVGMRNVSPDEWAYLRQEGLQPFWAREVVPDRSHAWIDRVLARLGERVFVTIDLDGFDPSVIPGVGTPEPGGLLWWDAVALFRRVFRERDVIALDVNELRPVPGEPASDIAAARLIAKLLAFKFAP